MASKLTTPDDILTARAGTTLAECVTRILDTWHRATDADREAGAQWYGAEATSVLGALVAAGAPSAEHAAAVIAHLSPRTTWARNVAGAMALVASGRDAALVLGCMSANVDRAMRAMVSDAPLSTINGPKTRAFASNLLGDREAVTVDVWAMRVAMGADATDHEKTLGRVGVYAAIAHAYRVAAHTVNVTPETMQATTWIVARNGRVA